MSEHIEKHATARTDLGTGAKGRLVVAVDGSPESKAALRWAGAMARRTGALIDAVTVWQLPVAFSWDASSRYDIDWQGDAEKAVTATVDSVFGPDRPAGLRTFALEGDPAHRLVEYAAGALLLVVGNRGRGGFKGLLLGSVSSKCAAHATCPVLIVHADDVPPGE